MDRASRLTAMLARARTPCMGCVVAAASLIVFGVLGLFLQNRLVEDSARGRGPPAPKTPSAAADAGQAREAGPRYEWSFQDGLPEPWSRLPGVALRLRPGALEVTTNRTAGYQLLSGRWRLPTGEYRLSASFAIAHGGLALSVLDLRRQRFLVTRAKTTASEGRGRTTIRARLRNARPRSVSVVFSNAGRNERSLWLLRRVALERLEP